MKMGSIDQSARIRNYIISGSFIIITILAIAFFLSMFLMMWGGFQANNTSIWSECRNGSANVFISTNEDLKNVKCVALDKEFFSDPEINIGDLPKNSEDVCRFKIAENTTEPLRFEVWYNGEVKREVCNWQQYPEYFD